VTAHVEQVHGAAEKELIRIPRPVVGGSYDVESLGPIVDRLMGDRRVRERAAETIRILIAEDEPSEEPTEAPVEVPPPVPGGSEPISRGDDPPSEQR
jgi:hypothetical protein